MHRTNSVVGNQVRMLVVLVAAMATLAVAVPTVAHAYAFHGCRWGNTFGQPFTDNTAITYRFNSVGSNYVDAFNQAQYAWDTKPVPGYFTPTTSSPHIEVFDDQYSQSWYALTTWVCNNGTYLILIDVEFNKRLMSSLSANKKALVAMHELGHTYGLAHVSNGCANQQIGPAVMKPDATTGNPCGGSPPYADDVNGVNARY